MATKVKRVTGKSVKPRTAITIRKLNQSLARLNREIELTKQAVKKSKLQSAKRPK